MRAFGPVNICTSPPSAPDPSAAPGGRRSGSAAARSSGAIGRGRIARADRNARGAAGGGTGEGRQD